MNAKRLWHTFRLCIIPGSAARSAYMKRKCIFAAMGNNVVIQSRKVPLYPQLIKFHNNIKLASSVSFINHDIAHSMINEMKNISITGKRVNEKIGCIEILDNVFIGSGTRIMYNVRIGPNVIIGTGSVVTKDIPPNSVVAGVPAKVIGDFDSYMQKRINEETYDISWHPQHQRISKKMIDWAWNEFDKTRQDKTRHI